jgi:hypothetical protein
MRSFPGTVIISFHLNARQPEIDEFFSLHRKTDGTLVSELTKTYAVDVPAGEEMRYVEIFGNDPLVRTVNEYPLLGKKWVKREPRVENEAPVKPAKKEKSKKSK